MPQLLQGSATQRNALAHSNEYMRVPISPPKKTRQRPASHLKVEDARLLINMPDKYNCGGRYDYTLLLFLYNCFARVSEAARLR